MRDRSHGTIAHRLMVLLAWTGLLLGPGCADDSPSPSAGPGTSAPVYGGTLVIGGPNDLGRMNSLVASEAYTQDMLLHALFLPLLSIDTAGDFSPALARSWEWEGDSAIVFHLRDDVLWHDGRRTSAHDVAFTFDRVKDPATAFPSAGSFEHWTAAMVRDSFTVALALEPHVEPLVAWALLPIMPAHALDSIPSERMGMAAFNHAPVGNGPFRFVEYRQSDRWVFEANPDFPDELGGRPYIDRVIWRTIPENTAQVTELITGGADLILSPRADDLARLDREPGVRPIVKPALQYHFIGWNGRRGVQANPAVRRAIAMAIDRNEILQALRGGYGELAAGPIGPFHWAFPEDVLPLPWDTAAARALLDEAGIIDRDDDGWRDVPGGEPFVIELKIAASNPLQRDIADMIQADLAAIGVRLDPRPTEFGTLIGDISSPERNFDTVLMGWNADFRINLRDMFHSSAIGGPVQIASYSNPRLDALLDTLDVLLDREAAQPRWREVQRILRDDQPWTFLWYVPNLYAARTRVRGMTMDVRGAFVTLAGWWLADGEESPAAAR